MKANSRSIKRLVLIGSTCGFVGVTLLLTAGKSPGKYAAHEWGTFTSVQGTDGVLVEWHPLESSVLPKFVYNWQHPGLKRQSGLMFTKEAIVTLQRMETPVIYFYTDEPRTVDVSVNFPQGKITEWYPQAAQIGPSFAPTPPAVTTLDGYAHKAGVKSSFTFASWMKDKNVKQSRARWASVELLPPTETRDLARALPLDRSGSHYFAARDTDAALLRVDSLAPTNSAPELEKFIFYRGVGNFTTPLKVTMSSDNTVTMENIGTEALANLFVLGLENRAGKFVEVESLPPGQKRTVELNWQIQPKRLDKLSPALGDRVAHALVAQGLYNREATAMVNTWKDSWFTEDGLRVLYILPRAWTDRTLPLTITPAPREVARVMVGRAEVITSAVRERLSNALTKAEEGDASARAEAIAQFKTLGRFAQPALALATKDANQKIRQTAWQLYQTASTPPTKLASVSQYE